MEAKKYLRAKIGARYWEDSELNGIPDVDENMPLKIGEYWELDIDLSNGKIDNWEVGNTANIHYKSVDNNYFYLLDENKKPTHKYEDGCVISTMCPKENGHGDYVIMNIDENGVIEDFVDRTYDVDWEIID